jgi:hypothetical protein
MYSKMNHVLVNRLATVAFAVAMAAGSFTTQAQISTATITVSSPTATAPSNVAYCAGATTTAISLNGSAGATFDVSGGVGIGLIDQTGVTSITPFTTTNATNATIAQTITVTPKNGSCTGTPVTFTITVVPAPNVSATSAIAACNGIAVPAITFAGTNNPAGTVYNWTATGEAVGFNGTSGAGSIAGFNLDNTTTASKVATIAVAASYTDAGQTCSSTGTTGNFTITAYPKPNATIAPVSPICAGTPAQVTYTATAGASPFDVIITDGTTPVTYNAVTNGAAISVGNPTVTTTYGLTSITDANGCVNQ